MKTTDFLQLIEWDAEDKIFIGSLLPYIGRCCHGATRQAVLKQLAVIEEDVVESVERGDFVLPEGGKTGNFSGKFVVRISPNLHRTLALRAMQDHRSLNTCVEAALEQACMDWSAPRPKRRGMRNTA